jgi:protein gp37
MAQTTKIEWTDVSWNPVHGCSKVSPGCAHCYAETLSHRYSHTTRPWTPANAEHNVMLKPHKLCEPLSRAAPWNEPCMVFVNSMSDLFHERVPYAYIDRVFATIEAADRHTFQILTKRPERMRDYMAMRYGRRPVPLKAWLGVSIENRRFVGRADVLRETPAAVRFISAEPLLGPLVYDDAEVSREDGSHEPCWAGDYRGADLDLTDIDWLIVGGESGPGHRPMRLEWAYDLVEAARFAGVAPFVKQLGGARPGTKLEDLPEDLRVREFPQAAR